MAQDPANPWQELGEQFHMMIGVCVAAWAGVDDQLFRIFHACVGPYEQCAIIYYRTPGLDIRLELTDELVLSILPRKKRKSGGHDDRAVKAWKQAKNGFKDLLAVRRRIAHHPVTIKSEPIRLADLGKLREFPPSWFEIYVSYHEQQREKSTDIPPLKIDDLRDHLIAVGALSSRLHNFYLDTLLKHVPPERISFISTRS